MITSINVRKQRAEGVDAGLALRELSHGSHELCASLNFSVSSAKNVGPIFGGLFVAGTPTIGTRTFFADHDQHYTPSWSITYRNHRGDFWITPGGLYGSGYPYDLVGWQFRVPTHYTMDLALGVRLFRTEHTTTELDLDSSNLTNKFYLLNNLSGFTGTHFGNPRQVAAT